MSTVIEYLADWASSLVLADIREGTRQRVMMQHLNMAAACRQSSGHSLAKGLRAGGSSRGGAPLVGGSSASRRDAIRVHAGLGGWLNQADHLFWSCTGPGAVSAAWALSKGRTIGELLTATVAANEVGGRLGASLIIGPQRGDGAAATTALCSAVASGVLEGLSARQLAHAMALALAGPCRASALTRYGGGQARALLHANPAVLGMDAATMAKAGVTGPLDILDRRDGLLEELSWIPLRNAYTGLGKAWLSDTLTYKLSPSPLPAQVPVQSVAEILARHMKAAGRRLRADQVERVEVRTSLPGILSELQAASHGQLDPSTVSGSMRRGIATLLVGHGLGAEQFEADWLAQEEENIQDVATRIEIDHCWDSSMNQLTHLVEVVSPLFAGLTVKEVSEVIKRVAGDFELARPKGLAAQWRVLKARPDRLMDTIRYASGDLGDVNWSDWQLQFPTQVRLFTTRGGSWPEKRAIPEGSPGWPWAKTVESIVRRYASQDEDLNNRARQLLSSGPEEAAVDWVSGLLH